MILLLSSKWLARFVILLVCFILANGSMVKRWEIILYLPNEVLVLFDTKPLNRFLFASKCLAFFPNMNFTGAALHLEVHGLKYHAYWGFRQGEVGPSF